jgi:formylglycine-generating enzyme required for sulfatase activity
VRKPCTKAQQRDGTQLVDITYDVSDTDGDSIDISVEISSDGGITFVVPATSLSGGSNSGYPMVSFDPEETEKQGLQIVWDAGVDWPSEQSSRMKIKVFADDGSGMSPSPPENKQLIPAGEFQMGRDGGPASEEPVHTVFVSSFYLDKFEVTKEQWDSVKAWAEAAGYDFDNPGLGEGLDHPVHSVTWYDSVKWCNGRSEMEGLLPVYYTDATQTTVYRTGQVMLEKTFVNWQANGYRLPTEAEWEKGAPGGLDQNTYPWGNTIDGSDANFFPSGDAFEIADEVQTTPVGYYDGTQVPAGVDRANGFGLYDVAGNVFEWCWDNWDPEYYTKLAAMEDDTRGPDSGEDRVTRGGSWNFPSTDAHSAVRLDPRPFHVRAFYGLRCAQSAPESCLFALDTTAPPVVAGDMNGDGEVNAFDIGPFVLALTNPDEFTSSTGRDPLIGDINGDGMLNSFDIGPFVDLLTGGAPAQRLAQLRTLQSPSADDDGDGQSNAEELMAATNPYDSNDAFKIARITPLQAGIEIEWKSSPGKNYSIEFSETAEPGSWVAIDIQGIAAGANTSTVFVDSNEARLSAASMFYRVVLTRE